MALSRILLRSLCDLLLLRKNMSWIKYGYLHLPRLYLDIYIWTFPEISGEYRAEQKIK